MIDIAEDDEDDALLGALDMSQLTASTSAIVESPMSSSVAR